MTKIRIFLLFLLGWGFFIACEKDDICVDGDTPLLIIRFYDAAEPTALKTVSSLRIVGIGQENPVDTFSDRTNLDSVAIPLRINEPDSGFLIILRMKMKQKPGILIL